MRTNQFLLPILASVLLMLIGHVTLADSLESGFLNPPDSARPQTWWHWMNGNITRTGITADLEAMKQAGVGGATILGAALSGPGTLLLALTPQSFPVPFLVAGAIVGGFGAVLYNIQQVSLRQAITPERIQGRMNSVMRFLVWGPIPLGSLTGGAIASSFGLRTALVVGAAGGFTSTIPIILSPIRKLKVIPGSEEELPTLAAGEGGLAPGVTAGIDESGAVAGAGPAAALDET